MFGSLRYQNPAVREHLASQYAMGLLTPLVKRRVEKLIRFDASFEKEVVQWQERLAPLNDIPQAVPAPEYVKRNVMAKISKSAEDSASLSGSLRRWWQSLWIWQGVAGASFALVVVLAVGFYDSTTNPVAGALSYVAVMQSPDSTGEAPLVISAYSKTEDEPSRLELHWNDRTSERNAGAATIWAIERETNTVSRLVNIDQGSQSITLTANQWQSVKNSLELVIVKGTEFEGELLWRGTCLQLKSWET